MQLPVINLNGTARSDLLEGYMKTKLCLKHTLEALQEIYPHGRDYQTLGNDIAKRALAQAQDEHSNRILKIRQVMAEIETLAEHVV